MNSDLSHLATLPAGAPGFTEVPVTWNAALGDPMRSRWSRRLEFDRLNGSLRRAEELDEVLEWNRALEDGPTDLLLMRVYDDRYLRVCPLCAKEGVHLARHQCLIDTVCPRHGTAVSTQCPHCPAAFACDLVDTYARLKCRFCRQAPLATPERGVVLEPGEREPLPGWTTWSAAWLVNPLWSTHVALVPQNPRTLAPLLREFRTWLDRGASRVWVGEDAVVAGVALRDNADQPVAPTSCIGSAGVYCGRWKDTGRQTSCFLTGGAKPRFDSAARQAGGTLKQSSCTWEHWVVAVDQTARDVDAFACLQGCQLVPEQLQVIEDKTLWERQNPLRWATLRLTGRFKDRRVVAQVVPRARPSMSTIADGLCLQVP